MSGAEDRPSTRWSLSKFLIAGAAIAGVGYLPLQLYILFGPRDGNPIGLGLVAVLGILAGLGTFALGLIKLAVHYFMNRRT